MIIKKYIVDDLKEAIVRAKYELGPEAFLIDQTKRVERKWYRLSKTVKLEVIMGIEESKQVKNEFLELEELIEKNPIYRHADAKLKSRLIGYCRLKEIELDSFNVYDSLDFINEIYRDNCFESKLGLRRINAFIGPTGVGKTTSIAKLAAKEKLINKKKVGVLTIDTYKIGALEQIKTYTDILDIPFKVAQNPREVNKKLDELYDRDLILIDTVGTSQNNKDELYVMKKYLDRIKEDINIFLTLSISTEREVLLSMLDRYEVLDYNGIVLTKLDELLSYEKIWEMLDLVEKPVEYVSLGERVPEDLEVATLERIHHYVEKNGIYHNDSLY